MLSTIRLHPNMTYEQLVSAMNENLAQMENLNKTQIFKDESGVNRIILGRFPDGTYGFAISQEGVDVVKAVSE